MITFVLSSASMAAGPQVADGGGGGAHQTTQPNRNIRRTQIPAGREYVIIHKFCLNMTSQHVRTKPMGLPSEQKGHFDHNSVH